MHTFTARHKGAKPSGAVDFASAEWKSFTPHRSPDLVKGARGEYQRRTYFLRCSAVEEFIIDNIDGELTIGEILSLPEFSRTSSDEIESGGRAIFEHQWKLGNIIVALPQSERD